MGNLPINGNLPIEAKGIPNIGWSKSQYRLQDLPVVGIAPVFALASIVCTYNYITKQLIYLTSFYLGYKPSFDIKPIHAVTTICQFLGR